MKSILSFTLGLVALLTVCGGVRGQNSSNGGSVGTRGGFAAVKSGDGARGSFSASKGGAGTKGGFVAGDIDMLPILPPLPYCYEKGIISSGHGVGNGLYGTKIDGGRARGEKGGNG